MEPFIRQARKLERDLIAIRDNVLRLAHMTAQAVEKSVRALRDRDTGLAQQVITDDVEINHLRFKVEEECYRVMAMQQPTARDMRALITAMHLVTELERIADHAAGISTLTIDLEKESPIKLPPEILRMGDIVQEMIKGSIDAYLDWNSEQARQVFARDDEIDQLDHKNYRVLLDCMINNQNKINSGTYLLWISHNLERIADRVTNICERVVFMVTGEMWQENEG